MLLLEHACAVDCSLCSRLTHQDALAALAAAGIPVNLQSTIPGCTSQQCQGCTSLDNIYSGTIAELINFNRKLQASPYGHGGKCKIQITGGTEAGHSHTKSTKTHWSGEKLDIKPLPCIFDFINSTIQRGANVVSNGHSYKAWYKGSARYMDEINHWDLLYPAPDYCGQPAGSQGCGATRPAHPTAGIILRTPVPKNAGCECCNLVPCMSDVIGAHMCSQPRLECSQHWL